MTESQTIRVLLTKLLCRPFIPQEDVSYFELQKQIHELETLPNTPVRPVR